MATHGNIQILVYVLLWEKEMEKKCKHWVRGGEETQIMGEYLIGYL